MQNNKKKPETKTLTVTLKKEIGKLWIVEDVIPFHKRFERFFEEDLGHDIGKLTLIGTANYVLDLLAGGQKHLSLELVLADGRLKLPDAIEFELVEVGSLSAKYYVNNCPDHPQLEAWISSSAKKIFKEYPAFAYIWKK